MSKIYKPIRIVPGPWIVLCKCELLLLNKYLLKAGQAWGWERRDIEHRIPQIILIVANNEEEKYRMR